MNPRIGLTVAIVLCGTMGVSAQPPFVFKLKPEMRLRYQTSHATSAEMQNADGKSTTTSSVRQLKEWNVREVDSLGVATMELTIVKLELSQTASDGSGVKYDSENPAGGNPELAKQMKDLVGKPILRVQMALNGQLKEAQNLTGQKNVMRELPFFLTVPDELPKTGLQWQRDFAVTLDPPLGNGRAYKAAQLCEIGGIEGDRMVVKCDTQLTEKAETADDRISLLQYLPKGEVVLDWKRGLMVSGRMKIDQKVEGFAGEKSLYRIASDYVETLVEGEAEQASKRK